MSSSACRPSGPRDAPRSQDEFRPYHNFSCDSRTLPRSSKGAATSQYRSRVPGGMESVEMTTPANVGSSGVVRPELDVEPYAAESKEKERACAMLENLILDDRKEHAVEEPKERRTKKVMVRADGDYIKYLRENPPPQPFRPLPYKCPLARESSERYIAQQKAAIEKHERILEHYDRHGYAYIEFVVYDNGEEEV